MSQHTLPMTISRHLLYFQGSVRFPTLRAKPRARRISTTVLTRPFSVTRAPRSSILPRRLSHPFFRLSRPTFTRSSPVRLQRRQTGQSPFRSPWYVPRNCVYTRTFTYCSILPEGTQRYRRHWHILCQQPLSHSAEDSRSSPNPCRKHQCAGPCPRGQHLLPRTKHHC